MSILDPVVLTHPLVTLEPLGPEALCEQQNVHVVLTVAPDDDGEDTATARATAPMRPAEATE